MKTDTRIRLAKILAMLALNISLTDIKAASFTTTGSLSTGRAGHTATLLPNGTVLVTGGYNGTDRLASCELYNPSNGTWAPTGSLTQGRTRHTVTLLPGGMVLAAGGGVGGRATNSCELYDPVAGVWANAVSMLGARARHKATLLPNGKVLVTGGSPDAGGSSLASAELYDPNTATWTATGSMANPRDLNTATLLLNGKVLVAGGVGQGDSSSPLFSSAELYDPGTGQWSATSSMTTGRANHAATLLPDGRVLITGGNSGSEVFSTAELYDPVTSAWKATAAMGTPHALHSATLLANGQVLVAGGDDAFPLIAAISKAEVYNPASGLWTATGFLAAPRDEHSATLLPNGQVLISGGYDDSTPTRLSSAELYDSRPGPVIIGNLVKLPSGAFQFAFTSAANSTNTILAATSPTTPMINWTALGVAPEFAPGLYVFSDPQATNTPQRFYRVQSP